jgi:hypothetical protein
VIVSSVGGAVVPTVAGVRVAVRASVDVALRDGAGEPRSRSAPAQPARPAIEAPTAARVARRETGRREGGDIASGFTNFAGKRLGVGCDVPPGSTAGDAGIAK